MKRIIPYKLFENKVNESETESIITDIFSDFMDDYDLSIDFSWGWALENKVRKSFSGSDIPKYGFKSDTEVHLMQKMIRDQGPGFINAIS